MCMKADEIRKSDYVCITLDEYIKKRRRQLEGNGDTFAEFDIIKTEAEIQNRITTIQIQQDLAPVAAHSRVCQENPSLSWKFKNETGKVLVTWGLILLGANVVYHILEVTVGFDEILKAFIP